MRAMVLEEMAPVAEGSTPLAARERPVPRPGPGEVLIRVAACGVCHTELDEIEGRTPPPRLPVIPGHQVVGRVEAIGPGVQASRVGDRVGVAWIHSACGRCDFCRAGEENLCDEFRATGRDVDGGYAEFAKAPEAYVAPIPDNLGDVEAAPLLCAGAVGYRSLRLAGIEDGQGLGLTGFGASGHLVLQLVRHRFPGTKVCVFARSEGERDFARELGAAWAGDTSDPCPESLHAVIDTTPAWTTVVKALGNLRKGGRLVINAIRKEDRDRDALATIDYARDLWLEKEIKSVANVTMRDVREFLRIAGEIPLRPHVQEYPLADANRALVELKRGGIRGGKVLTMA
ncbi:Alcohol dehydrogenase [Aquisphaera giovannonii]|uniref:alcohol dehydrogenase n=1 Tax=Aquisphaera giovannonii TaxID=406548 RepID=A0A5B9VVL8_9BACT|nr:zinc-dependent alcohol dehydrogenase family protein [Aquisphaera giovannonii]QEH32278.1 Alcohol dehydrogenase [Aquisphaera giovannonii]